MIVDRSQRDTDIQDTAVDNVRRDCVAAKRILMTDLEKEQWVTDDVVALARLIGEERRELDMIWESETTETEGSE